MAKKNGKIKTLWAEFKKFITRGNVLDMAVGVIIGGAFNAIVNALVKILMSIVTWAVPGGINGLITVLPAMSDAQKGVAGVGQMFSAADLSDKVIAYAASKGYTGLTVQSDAYPQWENSLKALYTLHGDKYAYNLSAVIDWGAFINAIISFLIIAATLFVIVKVAAAVKKKNEEFKAAALERYYQAHPEQRPAPVDPAKPKPTEAELLTAILLELQKQNAPVEEPKPAEEPAKEEKAEEKPAEETEEKPAEEEAEAPAPEEEAEEKPAEEEAEKPAETPEEK